MDTPNLDMKHLRAGAEYLEAIKGLGLDPEALFWAWDEVAGEFVLVLVTEMFDFKGPYELSKLLFDAYNKGQTPREIDPFVVRLHSPAQAIVPGLTRVASGAGGRETGTEAGEPNAAEVGRAGCTVSGLEVRQEWVYQARPCRPSKPVELSRRWARIQRNLERLAA